MSERFRRTEEVVGFALSGGGARSATQVGALKALTEAGIRPQVLVGTSAGAINAAWFAAHPERLDGLEAIWLALRARDVFPGGRLRLLANLSRHGYVYHHSGLERVLRRHMGTTHFEEAAIPCAAVALRLSDGQRVVFDSGEMVPAVMASCAIPGVFPPYRIGNEYYVDGGVTEYLPVPAVLERGATTVWAFDCSYFTPTTGPFTSVTDRVGQICCSTDVREVTSLSVTRGREVHVLRPPIPHLGDARDFGRTAELLALGYDHARAYLREALARPPTAIDPTDSTG